MNDKLSLTELQQIIRDSLYMAFPDFYWVTAEISEIKENYAGHCYMELIEKEPGEKNVKARLRAVIWSNRYRFLGTFFRDASGETLKEGMKVLIKIKIDYHELYGLTLVISDIDPAYTLGEMAMKRHLIIRRLEEEGVISMNRDLEFPLLPQRIAVISSESAAGYGDFINHLKGNSYNYVYYIALFEAVMQGVETEKSVISALDRIADHRDLFDAVAIIRGGGSQSDLSWFDNYNIAYHITQFPIPVITGIGHDKDLSVTDIVACKALKTPTAVADFLIGKSADAEARLNDLIMRINDLTRSRMEENRRLIESLRMRMIASAGMAASNKKMIIERLRSDLIKGTMNLMKKISTGISGMESTLSILDPENVLRRGYSITTMNGRLVKSVAEVSADDVIETRLRDGDINSKVI
jgi:exodeoxyribonuclease VII large subunit